MKKAFVAVGRPSQLRHTNALTILRLIREAGTCSRADLVRASGLSAPTVTNVVSDLIAEDLINPMGEGESSGGRPPDMISFKAERGCLAAVQITATCLFVLLTDLSGSELGKAELPLEGLKTTPEAICHIIVVEVRSLLKTHRKAREQLLAMVVAAPAITNVDEGIVVSISKLENWRSIPLRTLLNNAIDCKVIIENDTNLSALGERHSGAAQYEENFVIINVGANVSAGIVLSGHLHHGAEWSAGEVAYLRLPNISRMRPALYEFGALESVLTSSAILKSWNDVATGDVAREAIDATSVLDRALSGDALARKIMEDRAAIVSDIVMNLSLILNPGLILLGGEIGSHPALLNSVREQLQSSEFAVTKIAAASLGDEAVLKGAIAMALDEIPNILLPQPKV